LTCKGKFSHNKDRPQGHTPLEGCWVQTKFGRSLNLSSPITGLRPPPSFFGSMFDAIPCLTMVFFFFAGEKSF
jgi:hypothetical protein